MVKYLKKKLLGPNQLTLDKDPQLGPLWTVVWHSAESLVSMPDNGIASCLPPYACHPH